MEAHLCELSWIVCWTILCYFTEGYTERNDQLLSVGVRGDSQVSLLWEKKKSSKGHRKLFLRSQDFSREYPVLINSPFSLVSHFLLSSFKDPTLAPPCSLSKDPPAW